MKRKKLFGIIALFLVFSFLLVACTTKNSSSSESTASGSTLVATPATINVEMDFQDQVISAFQQVVNQFEAKYPKIIVNFTDPGNTNYINLMSVKRAANDLPDVFNFDGQADMWSPFCLDLGHESWVSQVNPQMIPLVSDSSGKIVALPQDVGVTPLSYNVDLLKKFGISTDTLSTWTGFMNDCQIIKTKSNGTVDTFFIGGGDGYPLGLLFDFFATPGFITPKVNDQAALLNGTFDWSKWTTFAAEINKFFTSGYLNADFLTAKSSNTEASIIQGKTVFDLGFMNFVGAKQSDPSLNWSFVPIPAMSSGDTPTFIGAADDSYSIWTKSSNINDCKIFLNFLAEPAMAEIVCNAQGNPSAINGVTLKTIDQKRMDSFNARLIPLFDRAYLPAGMWNYMEKDGAQMAAGAMTPQQYSDDMKANYLRLFAAESSS